MKSATSTWTTTTDELRTRESWNGAAPGRVHPRGNSRDELDLTASEAATVLEVRRATLSDLINNAASSAEMELWIEKAFGVKMKTPSKVQAWHDAYTMRQRAGEIAVKPYRPPAPEPR